MVEVEGEWKVGQNEGPLISEEKGECMGVKATYDHCKDICALSFGALFWTYMG